MVMGRAVSGGRKVQRERVKRVCSKKSAVKGDVKSGKRLRKG